MPSFVNLCKEIKPNTIPSKENIKKAKQECVKVLLATIKKNIFREFIQQGGLIILSEWITDALDQNDETMLTELVTILKDKLNACQGLTVENIKTSKIGKSLNSVTKSPSISKEIKIIVEYLIQDWKQKFVQQASQQPSSTTVNGTSNTSGTSTSSGSTTLIHHHRSGAVDGGGIVGGGVEGQLSSLGSIKKKKSTSASTTVVATGQGNSNHIVGGNHVSMGMMTGNVSEKRKVMSSSGGNNNEQQQYEQHVISGGAINVPKKKMKMEESGNLNNNVVNASQKSFKKKRVSWSEQLEHVKLIESRYELNALMNNNLNNNLTDNLQQQQQPLQPHKSVQELMNEEKSIERQYLTQQKQRKQIILNTMTSKVKYPTNTIVNANTSAIVGNVSVNGGSGLKLILLPPLKLEELKKIPKAQSEEAKELAEKVKTTQANWYINESPASPLPFNTGMNSPIGGVGIGSGMIGVGHSNPVDVGKNGVFSNLFNILRQTAPSTGSTVVVSSGNQQLQPQQQQMGGIGMMMQQGGVNGAMMMRNNNSANMSVATINSSSSTNNNNKRNSQRGASQQQGSQNNARQQTLSSSAVTTTSGNNNTVNGSSSGSNNNGTTAAASVNSNVEMYNSAERRNIKPIKCLFFIKGICKNGSKCPYYHEGVDAEPECGVEEYDFEKAKYFQSLKTNKR
ncbi:hypothetical protein ABK040_004149 [Willaertia magna]